MGLAASITGEALADVLDRALGDSYLGERKRQDKVEVSASVAEDTVSASARRRPHVVFLRSSDGRRLLGCAAQTLSVHVLAPYPGWERFIEQVEEAVGGLPSAIREGGLTKLAVRYIDRIELPESALSFDDFLRVTPPKPEPMPSTLSAFHSVTQTIDKDTGTVASLTLASGPPATDAGPVILYDLNLERHGSPLCELENGAWLPIVELLHQRQRDVFEASITDKTRELFS
tara:strand:- start:48311 stop:49003 length:693 start_codon:yes stop_codon:yes gene_type:complete